MRAEKGNKAWAPWRLLSNRVLFNTTVTVITMIIVMLIVQSASQPRKYRISIGERSEYDINAPFDMVDEQATERSAREAADNVAKAYVRSPEKTERIIKTAEAFAAVISDERAFLDEMTEVNSGDEYRIELIQENSITRLLESLREEYGVHVSREQASGILIHIADQNLRNFLDELVRRTGNYAEMEITDDNINNRIVTFQQSVQSGYDNENLKNLGISFISNNLIVNVIEDVEGMKAQQEEVYRKNLEVKKVISKGARILNVDEVVTEDKYALLVDSGLVVTDSVETAPIIRTLVIMLIMSGLLLYYINKFCAKQLDDKNLIILPMITLVVVILACRAFYGYNLYTTPVYPAAFLISYFIGLWPALIINAFLTMSISLFFGMEPNVLMIFFIGGSLAAFMSHNATQRSQITVAGLVTAAAASLIRVAVSEDVMLPHAYLGDCLVLIVTCTLSALLSVGLIALLEGMFNTSTPMRLTELTSGNNYLLRRLSFEAPGTHHHSLMVGYMSEAAAVEIGANPLLAKAGALYHDVGKLKRPEFYGENQNGANPHDYMDPDKSASIILSHTKDGFDLCERYKLPKQVKDIVREHHGDSSALYFYNKAISLYGEENVNKKDYMYAGPRPSKKESAIVMLADSCEAAVRSAEVKSEEEIVGIVERIIRSKMDDGQLSKSDISLGDVEKITAEFVRVLCGFYHTRVKYPSVAGAAGVAAVAGAALGDTGTGAAGARGVTGVTGVTGVAAVAGARGVVGAAAVAEASGAAAAGPGLGAGVSASLGAAGIGIAGARARGAGGAAGADGAGVGVGTGAGLGAGLGVGAAGAGAAGAKR